eukprot:scaffold384236_cov142-Cyclotella_meneghiniana.AAC.1
MPSSMPSNAPSVTCYSEVEKVRIRSTTGNRINLREVFVYSNGVNVALKKTATQSSQLGVQTADYAVDGSRTTFSSTDDESNAYWEVDLGAVFNINRIEIRNHYCDSNNADEGVTDTCKGYLSNAIIQFTTGDGVVTSDTLGDMSRVSLFVMDLVSNPLCRNMPTSSPSTSMPPSSQPSESPSS